MYTPPGVYEDDKDIYTYIKLYIYYSSIIYNNIYEDDTDHATCDRSTWNIG